MGRRANAAIAAALIALAPGPAGCGGDDPDPERPAAQAETIDPLPELPPRWSEHGNRAGGFALGVPPGWQARDRGISTQIESFDSLAVVSVTPDRTRQGFEVPVDEFAIRAFEALGAYDSELSAGDPQRFPHRYDGFELKTTATAAATGVRQRVRLIVLRRDEHVTFTVQIAASVRGGAASERLAERIVGTLRSQPQAGPPAS